MGNTSFIKKISFKTFVIALGSVLFAGTVGTAGVVSAQKGFNNHQPTRAECASIGFTNYADCLLGNPSPAVCKKLGFASRFDCIKDKPTREDCNAENFGAYAKCINQWRRDKQNAAHGYGNNNGNNDGDDDESNTDASPNNNHTTAWQWVVDHLRGR